MARAKTQKRASRQSKNRKKRSIFAYPLFIFLLLCAGVFLIAWTLRAGADDILVSAKVSAQSVTAPANIISPVGGSHFSSIPISVSGTCPANAGYVEIFDNNVMRGIAICKTDSSFALLVDLFPGANSLTAHSFNFTDSEGPVSSPVNVIYDAPKPGPNTNPLSLKTAFLYKGYHSGDQVEWPISLSGGSAPYAVSVDWGDGTSDLISRSQAGEFKIDHVYDSSGGNKDSYTIQVKATDTDGGAAFLQFFVIVTPKSIAAAGNIFSKSPPTIDGGWNWLWIAWPLYLVIILMALSYMLGEKEELIVLRKRGVLKR
jgi:hypothetical protein